jgi:hypothetical protein
MTTALADPSQVLMLATGIGYYMAKGTNEERWKDQRARGLRSSERTDCESSPRVVAPILFSVVFHVNRQEQCFICQSGGHNDRGDGRVMSVVCHLDWSC